MKKIFRYLNINSGDHINKKNLYMLFLFVVIIGSLVIRTTYAKFTSGYTTEDDIVGLNFDFNIGISNIEEYEEIRVSSYDVYSFNVEITNSTSNTMYYGVWYRLHDSGLTSDDIVIARLADTTTNTSGSVNTNDKLTVSVIVKNRTDKDIKIDIGVASSSNSTKDIEYLEGRKLISGVAYEYDYYYDDYSAKFISSDDNSTELNTSSIAFSYSGGSETYDVPNTGIYKLEAWGAQGGSSYYNTDSTGSLIAGGKGAYTKGYVKLNKSDELFVYVGGQGKQGVSGTSVAGGYNGGANGSNGYQGGGSGGGATDFRLIGGTWNLPVSLSSRIMVAAGGGGSSNWVNAITGGVGGALTGGGGQLNLNSVSHTLAQGGTQIAGGTAGQNASPGSFGTGGLPNSGHGGGGGAGYYGGGGGGIVNSGVSSGAGGSSYISGYKGSVSAGNKQKFKVVYTTSSITVYDQYNNTIMSGTPTNLIQNIDRTSNYIGKSNWSADSYFNGQIFKLKLSLANGTVVLNYDFTKNSIEDFSGNGYDGVLMNGASLKYTGKEYCLYLDGVDDYLQIPTLPSSIDLASGFTVEFEVIWNKLLNASRIIDIGNGENSDNFVISTYATSDQIYVATYQGVTTTHSSFATSSTIKTNGTNYGSDKSVCETGDSDVTCSYHYSGKVFKYADMLSGSMIMPPSDSTGNSGDGKAKITRVVPAIAGKDNLHIYPGNSLDTSDLCIDNGSGCEIVSVNPSDTSSLASGTHNIYFIVKDDAGVIYKINGTLYVNSSDNNLITGLSNVSTTTADRMSYSINDGVVTVKANEYDGNGYTTGRVSLTAGKKYIFSANSDGEWGRAYLDTVEAFLMLNGELNTYYNMPTNANYEFTPTVTGTYWLRLDVNKKGATHTFSNIKIVESS